MFTLIVFLLSSSTIQAIQIDGFSSRDACESAFASMFPMFDTYANSVSGSVAPYCISK